MLSEAPGNTVIGDTVERLLGGGTPSRSVAGFWNGPIPWASVKDFSDGRLELSSTQESITEAGLRASAANLIPAGVPIICTRMAVGRVASARMPVAINQDLRALFPSAGTDSRFLLWSVDQLRRRFESIATGSTVKGVRSDELLATELWIPPLPEQRRIAEVLDAADEAIRRSEALLAKLEQVKAGLLHDLLTRGLDEAGRLRDPEAHPEQFQDSVLGRIPRAWRLRSLREFASVLGGKRLPVGHDYAPSDTGFKYLRVLDFFQRGIEYSDLVNLYHRTFDALRRYEIEAGDLCIAIAGSLGWVGVCRPLSGIRVILTENAARVVVDSSNVVSDFLAAVMNSPVVQRQVESEKGTGGGVPKLALFRIEGFRIPLPPLPEQRRIAAILDAHDARLRAERAQLDKLRQIKKGLMHDLLTGKVRVQVPQEARHP